MPRPVTPQTAYERLAALCAQSERAEADLRLKLRQWGITSGDAAQIIARLKSENFVNAERYARAYVHDKWEYNGWGRIKIASMLRGKGIGDEVVDEALAGIDDERYIARLEQLLRAKFDSVRHREPRLAQAALLRFAASRGFEYPLFSPIVNRLLNCADED